MSGPRKAKLGATTLGTSCGEGVGSPAGFYRRLGFERSGEMPDDEVRRSRPLPE